MSGLPAARLGDNVAHTESAFGFGLGGEIGLGVGLALLTVATGGSDLLVLGAIGGAVALTGGGALAGMKIGSTYGDTVGQITTGSPTVIVNGRLAARTLADIALCDEHDGPQQIATGSTSVFFNGMPAARLSDLTVCDARISTASDNVIIGGGTGSYAAVSGEVPQVLVDVATAMAIGGTAVALGAGAGAAFAAGGWAGVGVFGLQSAGGLAGGLGGAFLGGKIGGAIDPVHGAAWGEAIGGVGGGVGGGLAGGAAADSMGLTGGAAEDGAASSLYQPKDLTGTEPGAVPSTPELQAQMEAANARTAPPAPDGMMPITDSAAKTFGADPTPVTLPEGTPVYRVVGEDSNPNGAFWNEGTPPDSEADWRGGSAVKGEWNGDGAYVTDTVGPGGLQAWRGPAAPQPSSDGTSVLPGGGDQLWVGRNPPLNPGPPQPTPWNGG